MHREGGELERFDRVIANPPFSQNYSRSNMEFPERFRWGWCPTTGKKGDLMFTQHMLAVCKPGGMNNAMKLAELITNCAGVQVARATPVLRAFIFRSKMTLCASSPRSGSRSC